MSQWRPIETAPKMEKIDICARDKTGKVRRWTDCHFTEDGKLAGWYDMTLMPFEYLGWMPIPEPPTIQ